MKDLIWRVVLPGTESLRFFARSEERISYWRGELARRFGQYGPESPSYQRAECNLIHALADGEHWEEALKLSLAWERRHDKSLTDERAQNALILCASFLGLGKIFEARGVTTGLYQATEGPVFGKWTLFYHLLTITLFADFLAKSGTKKEDEESMRYLAFLKAKQGLGKSVTLTVELRNLLALCQEERGDLDHALANYQEGYRHFQERDLFPDAACRIGLLARIYRMQKRKQLEEEALETRMWIRNLEKQHPELAAATDRYLAQS